MGAFGVRVAIFHNIEVSFSLMIYTEVRFCLRPPFGLQRRFPRAVQQGTICLRPECAACNICMGGFKIGDNVGHSPMRSARLRYGQGIYFSSVSGKADDFAMKTAKASKYFPFLL